MSTKKETPKSTKANAATSKKTKGLTNEELAAMKATLKERKAAASKEEGERLALEAIAAMQEPERAMAKRIHAIIKESAPALLAKTWYGMPAYTNAEGKVVCDFKPAQKFNMRYATLEFQDAANLDEGEMWPVAFALKGLTPAAEERISALVKKAAS